MNITYVISTMIATVAFLFSSVVQTMSHPGLASIGTPRSDRLTKRGQNVFTINKKQEPWFN